MNQHFKRLHHEKIGAAFLLPIFCAKHSLQLFKTILQNHFNIDFFQCNHNINQPRALIHWFFIGYWINTGSDFYLSPFLFQRSMKRSKLSTNKI